MAFFKSILRIFRRAKRNNILRLTHRLHSINTRCVALSSEIIRLQNAECKLGKTCDNDALIAHNRQVLMAFRKEGIKIEKVLKRLRRVV